MRTCLFILLILLGLVASSQNYVPVDEGSKVAFTIKNFGIATGGSFKGLKGVIMFDPSGISGAKFNITVDANTLNTAINARDKHLKKDEYFDVEQYPVLSFVSTRIAATGKREDFVIYGKLTIKGVTKEISFPFVANEKTGGYLFEGMFTINRRDFNVGQGSLVVSDNLNVSLSVFAKRI